ncbi:hypothetical protein QBZ16_004753 [Prototheca wickerhamii]|uniref:Uncharacterized protein n=1 Tax=Prototheca wickerhamii TaxID=3111 RepID=A0AAD9IEY6_PROWI|nr:hypothetical protein QBZ16_004753 [Prototheca wickerhamii]
MALVTGPAVTKRLSFALESLDAAVADHFKEVESTAIAKTTEAGEADLRRLKRQFGSLKSSFLHFEVKESFITSLLEGLPNGTEAEQLRMFEEELRAIKGSNKALAAEIEGLIEEVCEGQARLAGQLREIAGIAASVPVSEAAALGEAETDTEDDAALAAELAAAQEEARRLESQLAEASSRAEDAEAGGAGLRARLAELALRGRRARRAPAQRAQRDRMQDEASKQLAAWATAATELCATLTGVSIRGWHDDGVDLVVQSFYPTDTVASAQALRSLPCLSASHDVRVVLEPDSVLIKTVSLTPADTSLAALRLEGLPLEEAVLSVRLAIAGQHHRAALLSSCLAASSVDPSLLEATLNLGEGRTVALSLRDTWPAADRDCVRVAGHEPLAFDGQSLSQIAATLSA